MCYLAFYRKCVDLYPKCLKDSLTLFTCHVTVPRGDSPPIILTAEARVINMILILPEISKETVWGWTYQGLRGASGTEQQVLSTFGCACGGSQRES